MGVSRVPVVLFKIKIMCAFSASTDLLRNSSKKKIQNNHHADIDFNSIGRGAKCSGVNTLGLRLSCRGGAEIGDNCRLYRP